MMPAFVILALPLTFMYLGLETRHGLVPIPTNQPFVITIDLADGIDGNGLASSTSAGLEVTAPPLYVASEQAVYVRAELRKPSTETIVLTLDGSKVEKQIVGDANAAQMAPDRASGIDLFISYGPEADLDGSITGISVAHKAKDNSYIGIGMPWWLWWLTLMMIAAFGLKKRMGVAL